MSFTELAIRYSPYTTVKTARRTLRHWISINTTLQTELRATGYTPMQRILTPRQIELITYYLGEP